MNIKAVVKVMNFHALLRVESSLKKAQLYQTMQGELEEMMKIVSNNRNLRLDKKWGKIDPTKPKLRIYLGSDFGFCGSVNSSVARVLQADDTSDKIVIGKKLRRVRTESLFATFEDYEKDFGIVKNYLEQAVLEGKWSAIEIVYNHFNNISSIHQNIKQIYPIAQDTEDEETSGDFEIEDEEETLLNDMLLAYLCYEVRIAAAYSYASENTMRQNSTTQSLKKLDEKEEEDRREHRKAETQKSFKKTIDSYIKQKSLKS